MLENVAGILKETIVWFHIGLSQKHLGGLREGSVRANKQTKMKSGTWKHTVKYSADKLKAVVEGIWDEIQPTVKQVDIIMYTSEAIVKKQQLHETSPLIHPSALAMTT